MTILIQFVCGLDKIMHIVSKRTRKIFIAQLFQTCKYMIKARNLAECRMFRSNCVIIFNQI